MATGGRTARERGRDRAVTGTTLPAFLSSRYSGSRLALATCLLTVCLAAGAALADGECWVDAYNVLARMVNERVACINRSGVSEKAPGSAVTQSDLNAIRSSAVMLLQWFTVPPDQWDLSQSDPAWAFPVGLRWSNGVLLEPSLMSGIGNNGYFTAVPREYTVSGVGIYANSFTDVPLLWVHFQELYEALARMEYTRESYYAGYICDDVPNVRKGEAKSNTWAQARAGADARWAADVPTAFNGGPCAWAMGQLYHSGSFTAERLTKSSYGQITHVPTARSHCVHFYAYAMAGVVIGGTAEISQFDPAGAAAPLVQNRWCRWDMASMTTAAVVRSSTMLGTGAYPAWGAEGDAWVGVRRGPGWQVASRPVGVMQWLYLTTPLLKNPEQDDPDDDGVTADGCECNECLPQARADWFSVLATPSVTWPLGVSSGTGNGGLRVKAYVTEYSVGGGAPQQMFSLDTSAKRKSGGSGQWEFGTVKRPSGAEVVFALRGQAAGQAVNQTRSYRMETNATGCQIRFIQGVTHRFDASGALCEVRKRIQNAEIKVSGSPSAWPGLTVARSGAQITNVTWLLISVPTYSGNLIRKVNFHKLDGERIRDLEILPGSRRFVRHDGQDNVLDELRTVTTNGSAEIWLGVVTGAEGATAAAKEMRDEAYDAGSDALTVAHRRVLDPGSPAARSNVTVTTLAMVAGNWQPVREVRGYGGADPQTTLRAYYTNAAGAGAYGRLRQEERPDGGWTRYAYDGQGRVRTAVEPFGSAGPAADDAQCRVVRRVYAGDPELAAAGFPANDVAVTNDWQPRLVVERAGGIEVSRTYTAYLPDRAVTKRCAARGAGYDDAANQVTTTYCHTNGTFTGWPYRVEHADGTLSVYGYGYSAATLQLAVTNRTGSGSAQAVTSGTETVTLYDRDERPLSVRTRDIASGVLISGVDYRRDAVGRVTCASNVVSGTFETTVHGCYGPLRVVDAEGIETTNGYDRLRQVQCTARLGVRTLYGRGVEGEEESATLAAAGETIGTRAAYDETGRLVASTNETGGVTRYAYATNAAGECVETVTRPDGTTEETTYFRDGRPRLVSGTGVSPRYYEYGAEADGEYETEYLGENAGAAEWVKRYSDMLGRAWKTVYPDGYAVVQEYDAAGRVVRQSDGITTELSEYSADGRSARQAVDMNGNGTLDPAGADRIAESVLSYRTEAGRGVSESVALRYAAAGSGVAETVSVARAAVDGADTWSASFGRTSRTQIVRDRATASRTETITLPDGTRQVSSYSNGLLRAVERQDAQGGTVSRRSHAYDAFGRLAAVAETAASGDQRVTSIARDAAGQPTEVTETAGGLTRTTSYEYDSMGRLVRTVEPDGGVVDRAYGPRGELVSQSGARTYPASFTYDAQGRLEAFSTYRQGPAGPADVTRWTYDPQRGWPVSKRYADGSVVSVSSAPNGQPLTRVSARGIETRYAYDPAGSLTNVSYSDSTPPVAYTRDRLGRPVTVTDAAGAWTNLYAPDGQLTNELSPAGWSVARSFDSSGRLANLSLLSPVSSFEFPISYSYDSASRLSSVSSGDHSARYLYGPDGVTWTGLQHFASGSNILSVTRTFDSLNRLTGQTNALPFSPVSNFEFPVSLSYNSADQRTHCTLADGTSWAYEYDDLGQLTCAEKQGPDVMRYDYAYDTAGNRTRAEEQQTVSEYTANALNQYTAVECSGIEAPPREGTIFSFDGRAGSPPGPPPQTLALSYDADGNLLTDGAWTYAWDAENRLVSASNSSTLVAFTYDHQHRRSSKTVSVRDPTNFQFQVSSFRTFLYDNWNLSAEVGPGVGGQGAGA